MGIKTKLIAGALAILFTGAAAGVIVEYDLLGNPAKRQASPQHGSGKASLYNENHFVDFKDIKITTKDGRRLNVSAYAYCEEHDGIGSQAGYEEKCRASVKDSLQYLATDRDDFEASIPAVSADVRNHQGRADQFYIFPPEYAPFDKEMLKRALGGAAKRNYYTVTNINPVPIAPK